MTDKNSRNRKEELHDKAVENTFPASDPPASQLPDEPPANASAKWEAERAAKRRETHH